MTDKKDLQQILEEARVRFRIVRGDSVREEEVVRFFKAAYADQFNAADYHNEIDTIKRWEWANLHNPHLEHNEFPAWFCKNNNTGEIVGHLGVIPVSLRINTASYRAVWGRDMIVPLQWRRSGIASLLFTTVVNEIQGKTDLFLLAGANDYSVSIYKKLGFIHLGFIPLYIRVLKLGTFLQKRISNPMIINLLRCTGESLLRNLYLPSQIRMRRADNNLCIEVITYFDDSFDRLWEKASSSLSIITKRDTKSLNWRFVDQPYWDYKIFKSVDKSTGGLTGYIVLREGLNQGLRVGVISDFFARPDDRSTLVLLLESAIQFFEAKKHIDLIRCDILDKEFGLVLKKLGFVRMPSHSHFLAAIFNEELNPECILNRDNWFINYADSDLDLLVRR